jgi:hypothetical protein
MSNTTLPYKVIWTYNTTAINSNKRKGKKEGYVMPRHTSTILNRQSIANIIVNVLEIHDTSVIVILTREQSLGKISWMDIRKRVSMRVPSTKTEIKTTNRGILVVNKNDLSR